MKICAYICSVLVFFLLACGGKKTAPLSPEVAQDFNRYLTENHLADTKGDKHLFVLLHPGFCGSCTEQIQQFVKTELENCTHGKTLIFSSDKEDVTKKFSTIPGLHILKDTENRLQKYGLANGLEIYMITENGGTTICGPINTETIDRGLHLCSE